MLRRISIQSAFDGLSKLHRLAGLFELADEEFLSLRDLSKKRARESAKAVSSGKDDVLIDVAALGALAKSWPYLDKCCDQLDAMGINTIPSIDVPDELEHNYLGELAEHCERLKIKTIAELKRALQFDPSSYFKNIFSENWNMGKEFVLYLLLIGAYPNEFSVEDLTNSNGWSRKTAKRVVEGARKAKAQPRENKS